MLLDEVWWAPLPAGVHDDELPLFPAVHWIAAATLEAGGPEPAAGALGRLGDRRAVEPLRTTGR